MTEIDVPVNSKYPESLCLIQSPSFQYLQFPLITGYLDIQIKWNMVEISAERGRIGGDEKRRRMTCFLLD
uniref:Uncharacterized protein n=1 Tax=Caenorhabditis tropicalis TaxID=1561998 RepID=A0A1I7UP94_9PELO